MEKLNFLGPILKNLDYIWNVITVHWHRDVLEDQVVRVLPRLLLHHRILALPKIMNNIRLQYYKLCGVLCSDAGERSTDIILLNIALREKCPHSELFWSKCGTIRTRITPKRTLFLVVVNSAQIAALRWEVHEFNPVTQVFSSTMLRTLLSFWISHWIFRLHMLHW